MMETMSLNPEQLFKPDQKDEKPQLKLNLNLGMEDRWNTVLGSPDLKKIGINTPELDRMVAGNQGFTGYSTALPPPYTAHQEDIAVQGPSMSHAPAEDEQVTRSFIQALREIHEQKDFRSETFNIPATVAAAPPPAVPTVAAYPEQPYSKPAMPECTQSWNNFPTPASNYSNYQIPPPTYINTPASYSMQPEPLPQYNDAPESKCEPFVPDPNQIDKLNLTTAQKLSIYSQIPIHEVTDPELQERLKTERKKMRNRIAASKCRKRKLQKEAELEDKVKVLKKKNTDLSSQLLGLREEVKELKVKIMSHVNAGCNIKSMPAHTESGIPPQVSEPTLNAMVTVSNDHLSHQHAMGHTTTTAMGGHTSVAMGHTSVAMGHTTSAPVSLPHMV